MYCIPQLAGAGLAVSIFDGQAMIALAEDVSITDWCMRYQDKVKGLAVCKTQAASPLLYYFLGQGFDALKYEKSLYNHEDCTDFFW